MIELFSKVSLNVADVRSFGLQFLRRHIPRVTGAKTASVDIPGYGTVHVRPGESDVGAIRQVFRDRLYEIGIEQVERRVWRRYTEILESGSVPVIVDAGANIGAASLWFLQEYPLAELVALEPEPGNLALLQMNAKGRPRLCVCAAAIGSTEGFVSVENDGYGWAARTTRAENGVPVMTMARAFRRVKNGCPFIAKIDIEGFEDDLFSKNVEWLRDVQVIYIEPHDWMLPGQMTSRTFQRALAEYEFEVFISGENLIFVRA